MHLSRLVLDPRHRAACRDAANPYELHSTLARTLESEGGFLWRLEDRVLLVQSHARPDWGRLEPGYLARPSESKPLGLEWLSPERPYRFRLRANPTVTRGGKRYGLHRLEDQLAWLERQAAGNGFEPVGFTVSSAETLQVRKRGTSVPITLLAVTYDGHLRALEPDRLRSAVCGGLGHGKAFGLGLLSLAPVR